MMMNSFQNPTIYDDDDDAIERVKKCIIQTDQISMPIIINYLPTETALFCNYSECLKRLRHNYPFVPAQDLFKSIMEIYFMSKARIKRVLDKILVKHKDTETSCWDSYYTFNLTDTMYPPCRTGAWKTADNRLTGQGIASLVRTIRGGTYIDSIEYIAGILGLDFTKKSVPQIENWDGHSFVRNSYTYPYNEDSPSMVTALLGTPQERYRFYNANGYPSFFLFKWVMDDKPIHLFLTLQQNNDCGPNKWEFIAPPVEDRVYKKNRIENDKTLEVHIHDDISNADDSNSNTSISVGTWAGDLSFALDMDWTFLKGRIVKYLFNPQNPDSFEVGAYLLQAFQTMGTKLELYEYYK